MRSRNGCILDLVDDFWILRLHSEGHMFTLHTYRLIKKLLIECMVLVIVFAVSDIKPIVPSTSVQGGILFA